MWGGDTVDVGLHKLRKSKSVPLFPLSPLEGARELRVRVHDDEYRKTNIS